jgi:hypothetical protein
VPHHGVEAHYYAAGLGLQILHQHGLGEDEVAGVQDLGD